MTKLSDITLSIVIAQYERDSVKTLATKYLQDRRTHTLTVYISPPSFVKRRGAVPRKGRTTLNILAWGTFSIHPPYSLQEFRLLLYFLFSVTNRAHTEPVIHASRCAPNNVKSGRGAITETTWQQKTTRNTTVVGRNTVWPPEVPLTAVRSAVHFQCLIGVGANTFLLTRFSSDRAA